MNYVETIQMYQAAQRVGVRHMTAFTYRFVPAMRYLRHLGTEGALIYHLHRPHEVLLGRPGGTLETVPVPPDFLVYPGSPRDPLVGNPTVTFRYDQDFAFVQANIDGHDDIPTFYDGMRCRAVIEAVLQSARERRWVDVADVPAVHK